MPRFTKIIDATRMVLNDPSRKEWVDRYQGYARHLTTAIPQIKKQRSKFHVPAPFHAYLNLSRTKGTAINFQLRYLGQIVAELRYDSSDASVLLSTAQYAKQNTKNFDYDFAFTRVPWLGPEAKGFRAYFKRIDEFGVKRIDNGKKNNEHRLESALYTEFERGSSASKAFSGIQPVKFGGVRLGFPTPLTASNHHTVNYSGPRGGNVDILVRWGMPKSRLCVIELKDENKKASETPEDAVEQAIVYAVFLRELLRCPCGAVWWKLFGFSRRLPDTLHIDAMSLMPRGHHDDTSFGGSSYLIDKDCIQLHAAYFMERVSFQYPFIK